MSMAVSCIDLNLLSAVVKSQILGLLSDGTLQAGLMDCTGVDLGKARVPSCDAMDNAIAAASAAGATVHHDKTLGGSGTVTDPLYVNVCGLMTSVVHDSTLSGYGTCQSPLTVNTSWLTAFVLNLADTTALIHVGDGSGIDGTGTKDDPLTLDIQHDASLDGKGTTASPLTVDTTWLNEQISTWVAAHGVSTADGGGISGNGSATQPLALAINHDSSLDGDGTSAKPLMVDTGWLKDQIDNELSDSALAPVAGAAPATITTTDSVSTVIIGGTDRTMGAPDGYAKVGGYLIPLYKAAS